MTVTIFDSHYNRLLKPTKDLRLVERRIMQLIDKGKPFTVVGQQGLDFAVFFATLKTQHQ